MDESDYESEVEDDYYDQFNTDTFSNFNINQCFSAKPSEIIKEIKQEIVEDDDRLNTSGLDEVSERLVRVQLRPDSIIKFSLLPQLLLSEPHRRSNPMQRNKSVTPGRFDSQSKVVKFLLFDSIVMTASDKFNVLSESYGLLSHADGNIISGDRDCYYWSNEFKKHSKNTSHIIKLEETVGFHSSHKAFSTPVIRHIGCLASLPINGIAYPKLAISLDRHIATPFSQSLNRKRFVFLKQLELQFLFVIKLEFIFKTRVQKMKDFDRIPFKSYIPESLNFLLNVFTNAESPPYIIFMLNLPKGREFISRCLTLNNSDYIYKIFMIFLIYTVELKNPELSMVIFDTNLTNAITEAFKMFKNSINIAEILTIIEGKYGNEFNPFWCSIMGLEFMNPIVYQILNNSILQKNIRNFEPRICHILRSINHFITRINFIRDFKDKIHQQLVELSNQIKGHNFRPNNKRTVDIFLKNVDSFKFLILDKTK